jgi:hypothetical protein
MNRGIRAKPPIEVIVKRASGKNTASGNTYTHKNTLSNFNTSGFLDFGGEYVPISVF